MACVARILAKEAKIPGSDISFYNTAECGKPSTKKITIDNGDACFHICGPCMRRFMTKGSLDKSKDLWLGWFDCDYPPHAHIFGSQWYWNKIETSSKGII